MARRQHDFYETPPWMTRALLAHVPEISGTVLEPCVGDGSIAKVLCDESFRALTSGRNGETHSFRLVANDIDPARGAEFQIDASNNELYRCVGVNYGQIDWVITNPPYQMPLCTNIVAAAVRHARVGVAMMLRISFEEPTAKVNPRGPFLERNPLARKLVMPRHSFTGNSKSDSATTAWMIWSRVRLAGPPMLSLYRADELYSAGIPRMAVAVDP